MIPMFRSTRMKRPSTLSNSTKISPIGVSRPSTSLKYSRFVPSCLLRFCSSSTEVLWSALLPVNFPPLAPVPGTRQSTSRKNSLIINKVDPKTRGSSSTMMMKRSKSEAEAGKKTSLMKK